MSILETFKDIITECNTTSQAEFDAHVTASAFIFEQAGITVSGAHTNPWDLFSSMSMNALNSAGIVVVPGVQNA